MSNAIDDVIRERKHQEELGFDQEHDDEHTGFELTKAATCYSATVAYHFDINDEYEVIEPPSAWPWDMKFWNPKNPREDLVRAAALLIAEIERLDRERNWEGPGDAMADQAM